MQAYRAGAAEPVRAQRNAEQVVGEQSVRLPPTCGDRNSRYRTDRNGHWRSSGATPANMLVPSRLYSADISRCSRSGCFGVSLPQRLQLRGQPGLDGLPAQGAQAERHKDKPDRHRERDDRGHGGQSAENGRENTGETGDKMVGGVHRDAKET